MLFSGEDNSIYLTREYYQDYRCMFHLDHYPFDTQVCSIQFAVLAKTDNYVRLVKRRKGVSFLSKPSF